MKPFEKVSDILDRLLGPDGCPWDREQTFQSLRSSVLEETCELIEAVDRSDSHHIKEELGDLYLNFIFFCKIAEKEGLFTTAEVLEGLADKLIRRHPHIFGDVEAKDTAEVLRQWEKIKKTEAHSSGHESILDSIPKQLPALARAQKSLKRMRKAKYSDLPSPSSKSYRNEDQLGEALLSLVFAVEAQGLDAEQALRSALEKLETAFRSWERTQGPLD